MKKLKIKVPEMKNLKIKKLNGKQKKIAISVVAVTLVAATIVGIVFGTRGSGKPVEVYSFRNVGMTEYWGDSKQSSGPVTTDRIQTVFLTDTQTITGVKVKQGDMVKKGDVLMTYDTTLTQLQLERKYLEGEKLKIQLQKEKKRLAEINAMTPSKAADPDFDFTIPEPDPGEEILEDYRLFMTPGHNGLSPEGAFVCWMRDDASIRMISFLRELNNTTGLPEICEHLIYKEDCDICMQTQCEHGFLKAECHYCNCPYGEDCPICYCQHDKLRTECQLCKLCEQHGIPFEFCHLCNPDYKWPPIDEHRDYWDLVEKIKEEILSQGGSGGNEGGEGGTEGGTEGGAEGGEGGAEGGEGSGEGQTDPDPKPEPEPTPEPTPTDGNQEPAPETLSFDGEYFIQFLSGNQVTDPTDPVDPTDPTDPEPPLPAGYYVVFKTTAGNTTKGATTEWKGVNVRFADGEFTVIPFTPAFEDYTAPLDDDEDMPQMPDIDFGSGMTADEIYKMRLEQERTVKDLELKTRMAEAEYKLMEAELGDGNIYAQFDGEVVSLLEEQEAKDTKQPVVKVSDGGGFYIQCTVSELDKDSITMGQTVTVNDWRSGGVYEGEVRGIGEFPTSANSWSSNNNPNASFYPMEIFVDGEANLQEGSYVDVEYASVSNSNGIYLQNAFIRTEDNQSYVMVRGEDGKLEKRVVTLGKSIWGSYTEIRSGITEEDYIAFPYGKSVKAGSATVEGDISNLYSY